MILLRNILIFFKRLVYGIPTLLIITAITFLLMHAVPGGPFDSEKALPPEIKAAIESKFKLDRPIAIQFFDYIKGIVLEGDFGPSYKYLGRSVSEMIAEAFPKSLVLGGCAIFISILIGIPAGIISAVKHNSWIDRISMFLAVSGQALPNFFVAALLIMIFSLQLKWLPPALWEGPEFMILPTLTLGLRPAAYIARLTRASILEHVRADYVRTARAKGLTENKVVLKHILKNSLIPVITVLGPLTAGVVSGSFTVEQVFAIPGLGTHFVTSVTNRDYSMILGTTLVYASLVIVANIIVDVAYAWVDPRIRVS